MLEAGLSASSSPLRLPFCLIAFIAVLGTSDREHDTRAVWSIGRTLSQALQHSVNKNDSLSSLSNGVTWDGFFVQAQRIVSDRIEPYPLATALQKAAATTAIALGNDSSSALLHFLQHQGPPAAAGDGLTADLSQTEAGPPLQKAVDLSSARKAQALMLLLCITQRCIAWPRISELAQQLISWQRHASSSSLSSTYTAFYHSILALTASASHGQDLASKQWSLVAHAALPHLFSDLEHTRRASAGSEASPSPLVSAFAQLGNTNLQALIKSLQDFDTLTPEQTETLLKSNEGKSDDNASVLLSEIRREASRRRVDAAKLVADDYLGTDAPSRAAPLMGRLATGERDIAAAKIVNRAVIQSFEASTSVKTASLETLSSVCAALIDNHMALQAILLFVSPLELAKPLIAIVEDEEVLDHLCGPGAAADDEPGMLSRILLFVQWLGVNIRRRDKPSVLAVFPASYPLSDLNEEQEQPLISRWIHELFDSDGIGDELIKDSPPRLMIKLAPTLFDQAITAAQLDVIEEESLRNGLSLFLQDLLSFALPGALTWLMEELRKIRPTGVYKTTAAATSTSPAAVSLRRRSMLLFSILSMILTDESCPALVLRLCAEDFGLLVVDGVLASGIEDNEEAKAVESIRNKIKLETEAQVSMSSALVTDAAERRLLEPSLLLEDYVDVVAQYLARNGSGYAVHLTSASLFQRGFRQNASVQKAYERHLVSLQLAVGEESDGVADQGYVQKKLDALAGALALSVCSGSGDDQGWIDPVSDMSAVLIWRLAQASHPQGQGQARVDRLASVRQLFRQWMASFTAAACGLSPAKKRKRGDQEDGSENGTESTGQGELPCSSMLAALQSKLESSGRDILTATDVDT